MASSTPTRSRRETRDEYAHAGSPPSRETAHLDATVRFPPRDSLRLFASAEMRNLSSFTSAGRQISAARNRPAVPTSEASSFEVLCNSQMASPAESATHGEPRFRHNSPPNQANPLRSPPPVARAEGPHENAHADSAGNVFVQAVTQLAEQMSALSTMMRQFEEMRVAKLPSQSNQSTSAHPPFRPSVVDVHALANAPFSLIPPPSAPSLIPHADAYATLVVASRVNPQTTEPLALLTFSTVAGPAVYPANQSNPQTASPLAPPTLSALFGGAAFAPNPPTTVSLAELTVYLGVLAVRADERYIYCKWTHCPAARGAVRAARTCCVCCCPACSASADRTTSISSAYACGAARVVCGRCCPALSALAGRGFPNRIFCWRAICCGPSRSALSSRVRSVRSPHCSATRRSILSATRCVRSTRCPSRRATSRFRRRLG